MEQNRPEMKIKAVVMKNRNLIIFYFFNFKLFFNCWQPVNTVMIHLEIIISLKTFRITPISVVL